MEEQAIELGKNNLEQISLLNPVMGLLLLVLFVVMVVLAIAIFKLAKKVNEQNNKIDDKNEKLYNEAKADFALVLAFEKKLDSYLDKDRFVANDIIEIKSGVKELKSYLEFIHKQQ